MSTTLTKGEIVNFALRKFAVASNATLTDVEPQSVEDGVVDLEDMMAEWLINPGEIGYLFSADDEEPLQTLGSINSSPDEILQQFQQDSQSLAHTVDAVGLSALGAKDYYGVENDRAQRQNDQAKLAEQIRSNQASESLTARGQNISAQNARLSASGDLL